MRSEQFAVPPLGAKRKTKKRWKEETAMPPVAAFLSQFANRRCSSTVVVDPSSSSFALSSSPDPAEKEYDWCLTKTAWWERSRTIVTPPLPGAAIGRGGCAAIPRPEDFTTETLRHKDPDGEAKVFLCTSVPLWFTRLG
jgi:hypothetical protein